MRWRWAAATTAAAMVALAAPRAARAQQDAAAPPPATRSAEAAPPRDAARGRTVGTDVPELLDTLLNADTPREMRDEAARRLVGRQSDEARDALRQVVTSVGVSPDSRAAALRALAEDPNPSPQLLNDLLALLLNEGNDRIVAAAAEAVAAYKREPRVVQALASVAQDGRRARPQREAAARALGRLPEQPAAAALVAIVTNPNESPELTAAAADALIEMTGLEANGRDPARWGQWQTQTGTLPPAEWARTLLPARAAREDRVRHRAEEAITAIGRILRQQYEETPEENRPRTLLRYLNDPSPEIRRVGARIASQVSQLVDAAQYITEPVELRLVELAGDADAGVRLDAVRALENTRVDEELLLGVLLPQLRVETDAAVRQAIARKLSRARVDQPAELTRLLDELARLLDDPAPAVVREAAGAIRTLVAPTAPIKPEPAAAARVAGRLRAAMQRLAGRPGTVEARRAAGEALAALRDPQSRAFARELLGNAREPAIRGVALAILGELGRDAVADITVAVDNERERAVRIDGIRALSRTGTFDTSEWLAQRMNDPDTAVREAAADTYRRLLPAATPQKLIAEAKRRENNPALRVEILRVVVEKLKADGQVEQAAIQDQNIGVEYLRNLNRPDLAVPHLRDAHERLRAIGYAHTATRTLRAQLMTAMLQTQQYTDLAKLAQEWIATAPSQEAADFYRHDVGAAVRNEAERLLTSFDRQSVPKWQENLNNATQLVDAALKMQPPLDERWRADLMRLETELRNRAARAPGAR